MRVCPLCGELEAEFITHLEYVVFDDSPIEPVYNLLSCKKCKFVYCDTSITESELEQYYKGNLHYLSDGIGTGSPSERSRYISTVNIIEKYKWWDHSARIADIGSAAGALLSILNERGYEDLTAVDLLQNDLLGGIKTICGSAGNIPFQSNEVDVIILSHVLEHILDLQQAIREVYRVLTDGGIVYAEVPVLSHKPSFNAAPLWDYPYEHINYFTQNHLLLPFLNAGFTFLEAGTSKIKNGNGMITCKYVVFQKQTSGITLAFPSFPQLIPVIQRQDPCYIWGISQYVQLLLGSTDLSQCNIVGFLDASEYKQGKTILNLPIRSPEILKDLGGATVIFTKESHGDAMNKYLDEIHFAGTRIEL
jgi:SAM-dependent methyltransferase